MVDKNIVEQCLKDALLLQGQLMALKDEKETIIKKVEAAKTWLSKQPEYVKFLQHLQNILHQKNIGAFSELLSYFVKDVLQKDKEIIFDLYTYHNLPALKIEALNNGFRENIFEGNGGSIANIVSTGLRLIALSRLNHRKFIILDEPDCWLKPDHIPLFAKIIGEISSQLNIQTVIISHHHWKYFKDYGRVIELKVDGPHLTTEIIHDTIENTDPTNRNIIEKIILSRFMSHYDTVFELHPHLTCIIGDNDIGKSVLATAIKAVSYADSSDSYIMHTEKEAKVMIELSGKKQILWQRFLQTDQENTQKVKYSLFQDGIQDGPSEYSAHDTPERINKLLNICTTEDIDVHIGNQKQPVFLLSNDTKPQQRAKILSLGKESLIIQKMMENLKIKKRQCSQHVKDGEERYAVIEQQLSILDNIDDIVKRSEELKSQLYYLEQRENEFKEMMDLIEQLETIEEIAKIPKIINFDIKTDFLNPTEEIDSFIIEYERNDIIANQSLIEDTIVVKELHPLTQLEELIDELNLVNKIAQIEPIVLIQNNTELHSTQEIDRAIELISYWEQVAQIEPIEYDIVEPQLKNSEELMNFIQELEELELLEKELIIKQQNVQQWKIKLEKENEEMLKELGSVCPTCHQPLTTSHLQGEKHA